MILPPKCFERKCRHYEGIIQPDGTEVGERPACPAFPDGIPDNIAYGNDPHSRVHPDQVGAFIFVREE